MGACSNPQRPSISSRLRPNSVAPLIQRTYTMVWGLNHVIQGSDAYSGRCRPPVPEHAGPAFRSMPGHRSG